MNVFNYRLRIDSLLLLLTMALIPGMAIGGEPESCSETCEPVEDCDCDKSCEEYEIIEDATQLSGKYYFDCVKIPANAIVYLEDDTSLFVSRCFLMEPGAVITYDLGDGEPGTGVSGTSAPSLWISANVICCHDSSKFLLHGGNGGSGEDGTGQAGGHGGDGGDLILIRNDIVGDQVTLGNPCTVLLYGGNGADGGSASATSAGGAGGRGGHGGQFSAAAYLYELNGKIGTWGGNAGHGRNGADEVVGNQNGKNGGNGGSGGNAGGVFVWGGTVHHEEGAAYHGTGGNGGWGGGGGHQEISTSCSASGGNGGTAGYAGLGADMFFEQLSDNFILCGVFRFNGGAGAHGGSGGWGSYGSGGVAERGTPAGSHGTLKLWANDNGTLLCVIMDGHGREGGSGGNGGGGTTYQ